MNKITFKNYYLLLIALFFLVINNVTAQTHTCMVYDDLTYAERVSLGISEQEFLAFKNAKSISKTQTTLSIPNNYPITPKKFRIKFWTLQAESTSLMVRRRNGTDTLMFSKDIDATWLNDDLARRHTKILNDYYKDQQICFELDGIGILKTDSLYYGLWDYNIIRPSTEMVSFIAFKPHA